MLYFNCFILLQLTVFDSLELTVFLVVLLCSGGGGGSEISSVHLTRLATQRYRGVHLYTCTVVRANATWHPACLTKKQLSLTDIYCARLGPGLGGADQGWSPSPVDTRGAPGEAEAHTSHTNHQQIRSADHCLCIIK